MTLTKDDIRLKCVMLGDQAVGKTSLISRYILDKFVPYSETTIGATYNVKPIKHNGKEYKLDIWDTAGQERYRSMVPLYYRNAEIVFLCLDLSDKYLEQKFNYWYNSLESIDAKNHNRIVYLVGTKSDIKLLSIDETINNIVQIHNLKYIETSSKENKNINELFNDATNEYILNYDIDKDETKNNEVSLNNKSKDKQWYNFFCSIL